MLLNFLGIGIIEDIQGTIIGGDSWKYTFHVTESRQEYQDKHNIPLRKIAEEYFTNDDQAIAWWKANYGSKYPNGAEMRCYDR
jgi:hypothetical protein